MQISKRSEKKWFLQNNFIEGEISDMEALNLFVSFSNMIHNFQKMYSIFPAMIVIMIALIYLLPIIKRITGSDYMRSKQGKKDVSMWLSYYRFIKEQSGRTPYFSGKKEKKSWRKKERK